MKKIIKTLLPLLAVIFFLQTCKKDNKDTDADNALYDETKMGSYSYYQNGDTLAGASSSPHGSFKLRFNSTAAAALDSTGELPSGSSFPTGSILVKEIFSGNSIDLLAVMKKDPSDGNAGSGWIWAEFNTDGSAKFSTGKKGDGCISCHSTSPHRDLVRTFDFH